MCQRRLSILKSAAQLAVLYFPLISLSDLIESVCPFAHAPMQAAVSALLCFLVLFSDSTKTAWKKWGVSIPFTLIFWLLLTATHFDVRLTNKLFSGYGKLSAGAGFALIMKFGLFTAMQGIADLLAILTSGTCKSGRLQKLRSIIQNLLLPAICITLLFVVLYLEFTMPSWEAIYRSAFS